MKLLRFFHFFRHTCLSPSVSPSAPASQPGCAVMVPPTVLIAAWSRPLSWPNDQKTIAKKKTVRRRHAQPLTAWGGGGGGISQYMLLSLSKCNVFHLQTPQKRADYNTTDTQHRLIKSFLYLNPTTMPHRVQYNMVWCLVQSFCIKTMIFNYNSKFQGPLGSSMIPFFQQKLNSHLTTARQYYK